MSPVTLTPVIPAYNEGDQLLTFLQSWASTGLSNTRVVATVIVVDDGTEIPIDCHERGGSSLVLGHDPLKMIVSLVQLRRRLRRGKVRSS